MANGSVVNVDSEAHRDLAVAMRGGGSQFGKWKIIITASQHIYESTVILTNITL